MKTALGLCGDLARGGEEGAISSEWKGEGTGVVQR